MTTLRESKRSTLAAYGVLAFLALVGLILSVYRLVVGLGPTTNLSDLYPWGLWISLDVFLIPAAGAAFTISAISHFFGREDYHHILRPALLAGFLGYVAVALILILDLGRWHQFYNVLRPDILNLHSFLEEVALSVTLYTIVLILEFAPTILERWDLDVPIRFLNRIMIPVAGLGILISSIHQSSIGTMFVIMGHTLHPLWWTPILPLMFFVQATFSGLAVAAIVVKVSKDGAGLPINRRLFTGLAQILAVLLGIYLALKIGDWLVYGELGLLFLSGGYSLLMWIELIAGILIPLALLLFTRFGKRPEGVMWAGIWVVIGLFVNRLSVSWLGLQRPPWASYAPHWMEIMSSVGILAGVILVFMLVARYFDLFAVAHDANG
jgi:Ni/Fe-hydrogenase subunit HybB-like protein